MGGATQAGAVALTGITGIAEATAKALADAGIGDAAALAAVDPQNPPVLEGFSGALDWPVLIDDAKALVHPNPANAPEPDDGGENDPNVNDSKDGATSGAAVGTPVTRKPRVNATVGKKKAKAEPTPVTPAASKPAAASGGPERRAFAIEWSIRVGGTTFTPTGDRPKLTEKEHAQLLGSGAVTTPWLKGLKD